jgi:phosphatidate cytidylyltransferase
LPRAFLTAGSTAIAGFTVVALLGHDETALLLVAFVAVSVSLIVAMREAVDESGFVRWALAASGTLYLGIPVYGAIALRSDNGPGVAAWLAAAADRVAFGWHPSPRGLAWTLVVILATWVGDTVALLLGRQIGRRKLAPVLSPNKTVEGAVAGLIGSALVGSIVFAVTGLGAPLAGAAAGLLLGVAGQLGDLGESFLKRQAGVKDSGALIPGHGGVLDRIDALLFAFPVGLALAALHASFRS